MDPVSSVTGLLRAWGRGDADAGRSVLPHVYRELRVLARRALRGERRGHTLNPTGLVHEAWLRLSGQRSVGWGGRAQFFATAGHLMRQVLVDHARRRRADKRGGGAIHLTLTTAARRAPAARVDVLELDSALERLGNQDARKLRVVELRFFGGLTEAEIAAAVGLSEVTVRRDLRFAEAWLRRELHGAERPAPHR